MKFHPFILFIAVFATLFPGAFVRATEPMQDVSRADSGDAIEDEQAAEREQAQRLRRARAEHESRRAEAARKLEVEQARQREVAQLGGAVSTLGRREGFLSHELYWTQREVDSVSRDPADLSAMARRGNLERELRDVRQQFDQAAAARRDAMRQLEDLRFR